MPSAAPRERFCFRDVVLDVPAYELRRNGRTVRLERQPMDLLILLVTRRGQLVSRTEIIDALWGQDVFVDVETGVHTAVRKIRLALRDSPDAPLFIETVPGKGYRFVAPVVVEAEAGPADGPRADAPAAPVLAQAPVVAEVSRDGSVASAGTEAPVAFVVPARRVRPRVLAGVFTIAAMAGVLVWGWYRAADAGGVVTIAVLPFENLTRDAESDYLADGLAEDTIVSLGRIDPERITVIGRTSMMSYKGTAKSLAEIGRELHADYLVESSLRAEASQLRITSRLVRARDQVQVWSESFNRGATSALGLQQELSAAIAEQVRARLSPVRQRELARAQTQNAEAYDLFLRGRNFANQRTPATTRLAIEYFGRATALDPGYGLAWAGTAMAHGASPMNGDAPPREVWPRTRDAAMRAVAANRDLAEAQHALAFVNWMFDWNWPAAEAGFRRAIELDASDAQAHLVLAHLLSQEGRHDEARQLARRARDLDPLFPMSYALSSQIAFQARDYAAALEYANRSIALDRGFWIGYQMRGQAQEQLGQDELALQALTSAARLSGQNSKPVSLGGYILARAGRTAEARDVLATLETASEHRYVPPFAVALVHAGLGDRDAVFEWLERAYAAHDVHLMFLLVDPKWDAFRADPRFAALLARCNFTR